jgi:hypothetical protein
MQIHRFNETDPTTTTNANQLESKGSAKKIFSCLSDKSFWISFFLIGTVWFAFFSLFFLPVSTTSSSNSLIQNNTLKEYAELAFYLLFLFGIPAFITGWGFKIYKKLSWRDAFLVMAGPLLGWTILAIVAFTVAKITFVISLIGLLSISLPTGIGIYLGCSRKFQVKWWQGSSETILWGAIYLVPILLSFDRIDKVAHLIDSGLIIYAGIFMVLLIFGLAEPRE